MPAILAAPARPAKPPAEPSAAALLRWYDRHARILPWRVGPAARLRGEHADPYRVWLSEVMLQQTTVKAVAPYFSRFVSRWPTVEALAAAPDGDVMAAWAGLGYYSRARNLLLCARAITEDHGGRFPASAAGLARLPGIGGYTSAAIAAIAFGEAVPVVDGNVERVLARVFAIGTPLPAAKPLIRQLLEPLVPADRPGEFAEAVMDLGATICTPKRPACSLCPWNGSCVAHRLGRETEFPVKAVKKERPTRFGTAFVARRADGAILLRRRPPRGLLGGMTEVPGSAWGDRASVAGPAPFAADWIRLATPLEHVFTHFRLLLTLHAADVPLSTPTPQEHWWSPPDQVAAEALPSLMKKAIEAAFPGATKPIPARREGFAG